MEWTQNCRYEMGSSSFFAVLSLLPGGFSSASSQRFPIMVPFDFGTHEAAESPTQVPELQGTFSCRLSECATPVLLLKTRVPQGPSAPVAAGLVGQAGEPKLFPG